MKVCSIINCALHKKCFVFWKFFFARFEKSSYLCTQKKKHIYMKVSEKFDEFNEAAGTLSGVLRGVNYSIIVSVWILSKEEINYISPYSIIVVCAILSLLLDVLQYLWKSINIYISARKSENIDPNGDKDDHLFPKYITVGTWIFMGCKIASCILSAILLLVKII